MNPRQKFTLLHRFLHWSIALSMIVLFITGFLRMNWMNKNHIVEIISNKTSSISSEQATNIAKSIREPMWQWHEIFANIIIAAFVLRIIYMLLKGIRFPNPFKTQQLISERLQGLTYIYFYAFVLISALTGLCIQYDLLADSKKSIESIHKWGIYWFPIFILLHLFGIILAEHSNKKGITSKMIGGD